MEAIAIKTQQDILMELVRETTEKLILFENYPDVLHFSYAKKSSLRKNDPKPAVEMHMYHEAFIQLFKPNKVTSTVLRWDRSKGFTYQLEVITGKVNVFCILDEEDYKNYMATATQNNAKENSENTTPAAKETA